MAGTLRAVRIPGRLPLCLGMGLPFPVYRSSLHRSPKRHRSPSLEWSVCRPCDRQRGALDARRDADRVRPWQHRGHSVRAALRHAPDGGKVLRSSVRRVECAAARRACAAFPPLVRPRHRLEDCPRLLLNVLHRAKQHRRRCPQRGPGLARPLPHARRVPGTHLLQSHADQRDSDDLLGAQARSYLCVARRDRRGNHRLAARSGPTAHVSRWDVRHRWRLRCPDIPGRTGRLDDQGNGRAGDQEPK